MPNFERNIYNLTHQSHICGELQRMQMVTCVPVLPGDSFELNIEGIIRLAPLRKEVCSEMQVDFVGAYVKHRHIYPNFDLIVQEGYDGTETLPGFAVDASSRDIPYLGLNTADASIPLWLIEGPNRFWDRYVRVPSWQKDADFQFFLTGNTLNARKFRSFGRFAARLPHITNAGNNVGFTASNQSWRDLNDADAEVGVTSVVDIRDIEAQQGKFRSEIQRTWETERYSDVMKRIYGTNINTDADERPDLLFRHKFLMSGRDVDGTDDATLGSFAGKTIAPVNVYMPPRFFPEHGTFWVFAVVRTPFVHTQEVHPLMRTPDPDKIKLLADPDTFGTQPDIPFDIAPWFTTGTVTGSDPIRHQIAYGQEYRWHPSRIHKNFDTLPGYPFSTFQMGNAIGDDLLYGTVDEYKKLFVTSQLAHYQCHLMCNLEARRYIPSINKSIYVGAN